jgi:hypothetical protein
VYVRQIFTALEGYIAVSDLRDVLFGRISSDRLERGHFVGLVKSVARGVRLHSVPAMQTGDSRCRLNPLRGLGYEETKTD